MTTSPGPARIWRGISAVPVDLGPSVVTVGVFDGVHRGHQVIVAEVVRRARALGAQAIAVTFEPHPLEVLRPGSHPALLTTAERRAELLTELGIDGVLVIAFDAAVSHQTPEDFVQQVLVEGLHAVEVVVGSDFRFGHRAAGDVALLTATGAAEGFTVEGVGLVGDGRARWSSTAIREHLGAGDVGAAAVVLGRPHRVDGVVVEGDRRGRDLGFPTANLEPVEHAALPADGVYAGRLVRLDLEPGDPERSLPAAISVGANATFEGTTHRVEAYVLDRDDLALYGRPVGLEFVERLRAMERFGSVAELLEQIAQDVTLTRAALSR